MVENNSIHASPTACSAVKTSSFSVKDILQLPSPSGTQCSVHVDPTCIHRGGGSYASDHALNYRDQYRRSHLPTEQQRDGYEGTYDSYGSYSAYAHYTTLPDNPYSQAQRAEYGQCNTSDYRDYTACDQDRFCARSFYEIGASGQMDPENRRLDSVETPVETSVSPSSTLPPSPTHLPGRRSSSVYAFSRDDFADSSYCKPSPDASSYSQDLSSCDRDAYSESVRKTQSSAGETAKNELRQSIDFPKDIKNEPKHLDSPTSSASDKEPDQAGSWTLLNGQEDNFSCKFNDRILNFILKCL